MLKFVDLFCGAGFGASGAVKAKGIPILAVDSWELAAKTYRSNFPNAHVICSPIEDLDPNALAKRYKPDVLLTSPECTSHSIARGARLGSESSRETAMEIIRWLEAMQPRWLILENVNRMRQWGRHEELTRTIESLSYRISDLYLDAADFGAPQSRKRMFLVCDRGGTLVTRDDLLSLHNRKIRNARSIIDWSGKYKSKQLRIESRASATLERADRAISSLGKGVDFLIVYYGSDYAGGWQSLDVPLRTVTTLDRFGLVTWDNGSARLRMLQPSELVKAMGAGSRHSLPLGTRREKIKLCGNGVCSPVLELIFKKITAVHVQSVAKAS